MRIRAKDVKIIISEEKAIGNPMQAFPPCEVCGEPGTHLVQDVKEVPSDSEWIKWERDGKFHYYCDEHTRPPQYTVLLGQEQLDVDMAGWQWSEGEAK